MFGSALLLVGLVSASSVLVQWIGRGLGSLSEQRLALVGLTLMVLGLQVVFSAFFLSILGLPRRSGEVAADDS